jgi:hypothetical protein
VLDDVNTACWMHGCATAQVGAASDVQHSHACLQLGIKLLQFRVPAQSFVQLVQHQTSTAAADRAGDESRPIQAGQQHPGCKSAMK